MVRLSANIGILYREYPFLTRFALAARAGFAAVECWTPYEYPIAELRRCIGDSGIPLIGINTAGGDPKKGEAGFAGMPGRERDFDAAIAQALDYGAALGVRHIHVLAGSFAGHTEEECFITYRHNLARAVRLAEAAGVTLVIEPVNRRDRPTYLLSTAERAAEIIDEIDSPHLKMMFDFYHMQIMGGDIVRRFAEHLPRIAHIQFAAVPSRAEPDEGELDYAWILREIDRLGWTGFVGAEYQPRGKTEDGLGWMKKLGVTP